MIRPERNLVFFFEDDDDDLPCGVTALILKPTPANAARPNSLAACTGLCNVVSYPVGMIFCGPCPPRVDTVPVLSYRGLRELVQYYPAHLWTHSLTK